MVICQEGVSLGELDEALSHVAKGLKTDTYGNRLTWQRRNLLIESMDSLLDERLSLMAKQESLVGAE